MTYTSETSTSKGGAVTTGSVQTLPKHEGDDVVGSIKAESIMSDQRNGRWSDREF